MSALTDLQNLFRDLFQLELADLDFGIYRLLRLKREEIEAFLTKQLPDHVEKAFESFAGEERAALESELAAMTDRIHKEVSEDALLANGEINQQYQFIKVKAAQELLQRYQSGREKLKSVQASEAQMAEVFNHLYSFFARYYDSGDFIPRRRYGVAAQISDENAFIMDFFAGSGTTAHAVVSLNREEKGRRRFILVEMADYFDTVLLPRVQKAIYAPEWKDGKPILSTAREVCKGTPRIVKVLRMEAYDDALHNLVTDGTMTGEQSRAKAHKKLLGNDSYRLHYLVRLPLESSAAMLNVEALEHPFEYKIEVLTENGPRIEAVDLVETFNLLYGLHVSRLETWISGKDNCIYKAVKGKKYNGESALILWRDMTDLEPVAEREFLEAKLKAEGPFDEVLINGDSATPGVKSLDGIFKRLLEEEER